MTSEPAHADVDVYVLAEVAKPEDCDAIGATGRPVLAVLNKADLIATTESGRHPGGRPRGENPLPAAVRPHRYTIEPLVGVRGRHARRPGGRRRVGRAAGAGRRGFRRGAGAATAVDVLGIFGIAQAIAAIRRGSTRVETVTLLRRLSCIDEVVDAIEALGAQVRYHRLLDAVADLETWPSLTRGSASSCPGMTRWSPG